MDHAIILRFDEETENKIMEIIERIAQSCGNRYMLDEQIPPHLTVSYFCCERIEPVIDKIDAHISDFSRGEIRWTSLGAFVPQVLFAAPVLREYLMDMCVRINGLVEDISVVGDSGHYLPYQWVPHTTLATKLNQEELCTAFEISVKSFTAFAGEANRLVLAECSPYRAVKEWELPNIAR